MMGSLASDPRLSPVARSPLLGVIAALVFVSADEVEALEIRVRYHEEVAAWEQQGGAAQVLLEQIQSTMERATDVWESTLTDTIVIHLEVQTRDRGSFLASAGPILRQISYPALREALQEDALSANDRIAIENLPTSAPLVFWRNDGNGGVVLDDDGGDNNLCVNVSGAIAKALGLLPSEGSAIDGVMFVNSAFPPEVVLLGADFDRSDGVAAEKIDVQSVIEHEIGHALGFSSPVVDLDPPAGGRELEILNLFRFGEVDPEMPAGPPLFNAAAGGQPYFSIDGGKTSLAEFDPASNHWRGLAVELPDGTVIERMPAGLMIPKFQNGAINRISSLDLLAFDVMGFDLAPSPQPGLADLRIVRDSGRLSARFVPTSVVSDSPVPRLPAYRFQVSSDLRVWRDVAGIFVEVDGVLAEGRFDWQPELSGFQFVRLAGGIDLGGEDLSHRDLSWAHLVGADLSNAELFKTDFRECQLDRADFRGSNLAGAQFAFATLRSADLSDCDLERANFYRADLEGTAFDNARFKETVMPDGSLRSDP